MSSNSSISSVEEGNTKPPQPTNKKQISPAIRWCFTLNNYTEEECSSIVPILDQNCKYAIVGKEVGAQGTPHLQGYLEFNTKKRPLSVFDNKRFHFEKAKGNRESNYNYCKKDLNIFYLKGFPKPPTTIARSQFYPWQEEIVKIFEQPCPWDDRTIYWRYGDVNIGKTQFAKWLCVHLNACVIGGEKKHMLAQVQNQVSNIYIVLLSYGDEKVSYRAIEQIKDGLFSSSFGCDNNSMEVRDAPHILIIGNEPPDYNDRHFHPTKYDVKEIGL